jgi:hypothetical protein
MAEGKGRKGEKGKRSAEHRFARFVRNNAPRFVWNGVLWNTNTRLGCSVNRQLEKLPMIRRHASCVAKLSSLLRALRVLRVRFPFFMEMTGKQTELQFDGSEACPDSRRV